MLSLCLNHVLLLLPPTCLLLLATTVPVPSAARGQKKEEGRRVGWLGCLFSYLSSLLSLLSSSLRTFACGRAFHLRLCMDVEFLGRGGERRKEGGTGIVRLARHLHEQNYLLPCRARPPGSLTHAHSLTRLLPSHGTRIACLPPSLASCHGRLRCGGRGQRATACPACLPHLPPLHLPCLPSLLSLYWPRLTAVDSCSLRTPRQTHNRAYVPGSRCSLAAFSTRCHALMLPLGAYRNTAHTSWRRSGPCGTGDM